MSRLSDEQIIHHFLVGAARGINRAMNIVAADSLREAPLGPAKDAPKGPHGEQHEGGSRSGGELRGSIIYPLLDEDGSHTATAEKLEAMASYNTVYAAAQHEGVAMMTNHHTGEKYRWEVRVYTTPGTKRKYVEDPLKAMAGGGTYEKILAEEISGEMQAAEAAARLRRATGR